MSSNNFWRSILFVVEMCLEISMNIIVVLRLLHKYFYGKIYNFKKDFTPLIWRKWTNERLVTQQNTKYPFLFLPTPRWLIRNSFVLLLLVFTYVRRSSYHAHWFTSHLPTCKPTYSFNYWIFEAKIDERKY